MTWSRSARAVFAPLSFTLAALLSVAFLSGCGSSEPTPGDVPGGKDTTAKGKTHAPVSELTKTDTVVGTGVELASGDTAEVEYTGSLGDGTVFDTNTTPGKMPFQLVVGAGSVIKGWDQGLVGMKVGGTRELGIPWALAYGAEGKPPTIPPKADLYFTVKLLAAVKKGQEAVFDTPKDTKVGTGAVVKDGDWVKIKYKAEYLNGKIYAESSDKPLEFQTITGLTPKKDKMGVVGLCYALKGMKVGGTREILLPPAIAYPGESREGPQNPTNLTLKYTVELLAVKPGTLPPKGSSN